MYTYTVTTIQYMHVSYIHGTYMQFNTLVKIGCAMQIKSVPQINFVNGLYF